MKNKLNIFTGGYMPWYPRNWWKNICYFFRTIKWGWQRAIRGYSDYDTWDLDVYYSRMMIASLSQFRAETRGYPGYMDSIEEWYAILDKIIFLLKQANEDEPLEEKNETVIGSQRRLPNFPNAAEGYEHKPYISGFLELLFIIIGN